MLEKPDLPDQLIIAGLLGAYGLQVKQLTFLPLGADVNSAVYRAVVADEVAYFLKLRKGDFDAISVMVPQFLAAQGIRAVIAPLETLTHLQWVDLGVFKMILYPYIEGLNGYEAALSDQQWLDFGAALRAIHTVHLPPALAGLIPRETYSPHWRELVRVFQAQVEDSVYADPIAVELAEFMKARRAEIRHLLARAEALAAALQARNLELVLCHADIHAGNLLLGADGALRIVDWENPIFAPKERDLALVGGSHIWSNSHCQDLFYHGYLGSHGYQGSYGYLGDRSSRIDPVNGPAEVDGMALAYYRCERAIMDIAEFCKQLLWSMEGGVDREQSLIYFNDSFLPGHEVDLACRTDGI